MDYFCYFFKYYYFATFIIIIFIYKAQYPNMLKALYNKIESYLLCIKTNIFINNNKYNCKIYFQKKNCRNVKGQTKLTFTWHTPNRVNIK